MQAHCGGNKQSLRYPELTFINIILKNCVGRLSETNITIIYLRTYDEEKSGGDQDNNGDISDEY